MEAVVGCNYLYRRGGTYWFRRRVPDDVLDTLGRSAWRESLHTKDFEQAKQAARRRGVETDRLIATARAKLTGQASTPLDASAAQAMAATWLEAVLADEEDSGRLIVRAEGDVRNVR